MAYSDFILMILRDSFRKILSKINRYSKYFFVTNLLIYGFENPYLFIFTVVNVVLNAREISEKNTKRGLSNVHITYDLNDTQYIIYKHLKSLILGSKNNIWYSRSFIKERSQIVRSFIPIKYNIRPKPKVLGLGIRKIGFLSVLLSGIMTSTNSSSSYQVGCLLWFIINHATVMLTYYEKYVNDEIGYFIASSKIDRFYIWSTAFEMEVANVKRAKDLSQILLNCKHFIKELIEIIVYYEKEEMIQI